MARILVFEDDLVLGGLIVSALSGEKHEISEANSLSAAIKLAKDAPLGFDLVLTEVGAGADLAKYLLRARKANRIVFMSEFASVIDAIRGGVSEEQVLRKPFTADELRKRVRKILASVRRKSKSATANGTGSKSGSRFPADALEQRLALIN